MSNLLVRELVKQTVASRFADDLIVSIGSYYDRQVQIEILTIRKSGKMLADECKYSKAEAKINMPNALMNKCQKAELNIADYVLFSKNGFTPEVEQMQDAEMILISYAHLSSLLDNLSKDDLLVYKNKKY